MFVNRGTPIEKSYETIVRTDDRDLIRQEYINHNWSTGPDIADVQIPGRTDIIDKTNLPQVGEWGSASDAEPYGHGVWVVNGGMIDIWTGLSGGFDSWRAQNATYREHDMLDNALRLTSAYRNPERNERVGGSATSQHMKGGANDIAFADLLNQIYLDRGIVFGALWDWTKANHGVRVPKATFWQLEDSGSVAVIKSSNSQEEKEILLEPDQDENGVPDVFERTFHLHIQR